MRSFIAILLLSGIMLQNMGRFIIIVNYELNKTLITQQYCENKDKPLLACKGKCHLKKELAKQEKKETIPINNAKEEFEISFFSQLVAVQYFSYSIGIIKFIPFNSNLINSPSFSIFHPPKISNC